MTKEEDGARNAILLVNRVLEGLIQLTAYFLTMLKMLIAFVASNHSAFGGY